MSPHLAYAIPHDMTTGAKYLSKRWHESPLAGPFLMAGPFIVITIYLYLSGYLRWTGWWATWWGYADLAALIIAMSCGVAGVWRLPISRLNRTLITPFYAGFVLALLVIGMFGFRGGVL